MKTISTAQIRAIKMMQRRLGLDDGDYREMLRSVAGVSSCKDLAGPKIDRVIRHLHNVMGQGQGAGKGPGARSQGAEKQWSGARGQGPGGSGHGEMATDEQLQKIWALWNEVSRAPLAKRKVALQAFLLNRYKINAVNWLTKELAVKVIEGLKKMRDRD